ncbi:hypothetical protein MMC29_007660 [Sticta canariensis]|nr:hypothetical protein [Sticta canariensis]
MAESSTTSVPATRAVAFNLQAKTRYATVAQQISEATSTQVDTDDPAPSFLDLPRITIKTPHGPQEYVRTPNFSTTGEENLLGFGTMVTLWLRFKLECHTGNANLATKSISVQGLYKATSTNGRPERHLTTDHRIRPLKRQKNLGIRFRKRRRRKTLILLISGT